MKAKNYHPVPHDELHKCRLYRFIRKGENPDACWEWTGSAIKDGGHGRIRINDIEYVASRLSYAVHAGRDPGELDVCHSCDNPRCTNPRHLFLGTHTQNMRDASSKGRFSRKPRRVTCVGEAHPGVKLTDAQVAEIREIYRTTTETQRAIGQRFGVSQGTVSEIVGLRKRKSADARWEWAPIATAPRDGTEVLLWCGQPVCGHHSSDHLDPERREDGWVTDIEWPGMMAPTAWLPIPKIPEALSKSAAALELDDFEPKEVARRA